MTSVVQSITDLTTAIKVTESFPFSLTFEKSTDPTKRPVGMGWKVASALQVALQNATKEILVVVGPTKSNAYYYK
jgi:hypothetical protein